MSERSVPVFDSNGSRIGTGVVSGDASNMTLTFEPGCHHTLSWEAPAYSMAVVGVEQLRATGMYGFRWHFDVSARELERRMNQHPIDDLLEAFHAPKGDHICYVPSAATYTPLGAMSLYGEVFYRAAPTVMHTTPDVVRALKPHPDWEER